MQPVLFEEFAGVFDGRLDNRDELVALLGVSHTPRSITDAELAVRAYSRWSRDAASHLLGDFGLAVWDQRQRHLYCARDPFGVRPLYFSTTGSTLVVGTDIRSVLAHPSVPIEPNERHAAAILLARLTNHTDTLYRGVERVPPGHALTVRDGQVSTHRYWNPGSGRRSVPPRSADRVGEFVRLFEAATRSRLRARTAPTVALSGGLDS
jgi:asparagine synthase (glutamine-hydrolysing)